MGQCFTSLVYKKQVDTIETCIPVHILWDHENIPSGNADSIRNVMTTLKTTVPELVLSPIPDVCVYRVQHAENSKHLDSIGCQLVTCPQHTSNHKEVVDKRIINDLWKLVFLHRPVVIVLVANDGDYVQTMSQLKMIPGITTVQCFTESYANRRSGAQHKIAWREQILERNTLLFDNDEDDITTTSSEPALGAFLRHLYVAVHGSTGLSVSMGEFGKVIKEHNLGSFKSLHKQAYEQELVQYSPCRNMISLTPKGMEEAYPQF